MTAMADGGQPVVLVVDDDQDLADMYSESLADQFEVRTAYGGDEALEAADDDVEVVLLDRRMPDRSGDEVLEALRDRGFEGQVVMLTAVSPDFDVLEMGFDDYVVKPVSPSEVSSVVSRMVSVGGESETHQAFSALVSKKLALESKKGAAELQSSEEYTALLDDIAELRQELGREEATRLTAAASAAVFEGLDDMPAMPAVGGGATDGATDDDEADDDATDEGTTVESRYDKLRAGDGLYGALFEGLPDPVFVVGPDRNVLDCNPAFSEQFGYSADEIRGEPVTTLYAGGTPPQASDTSSGAVTAEYETSDGDVFSGETTIIRFREGGGTLASAAVVRPV